MPECHAWDNVRGLERLSLCDWPGRPCAVLFLGGCNLLCPTCHNPELAWHMDRLPAAPAVQIKALLAGRRKWLDGLVVTGGEPTLAPGLPELLLELGELGLPIKLDTNGMRPEVVEDILDFGLVSLVAVDVKGPFDMYPALTGGAALASDAAVNLTRLFSLASRRPHSFLFRLTKVPALEDADVADVRACLPRGFDLSIQQYQAPRRTYALADHETGRPARDLVH